MLAVYAGLYVIRASDLLAAIQRQRQVRVLAEVGKL